MKQEPPQLISLLEVFEIYPELQTHLHWTRKHIISFIEGELLKGHYSATLKTYVFYKSSLLNLVNFANDIKRGGIVSIED